MRRREILGLQSEHVNFVARSVFIAKSKTGRTRTIPMNDIVLKELVMLKQNAGPQEFVFSNARTGVNIDSIKTGWRNACENAGLVNLRLYSRHLRNASKSQWRSRMGHSRSTWSHVSKDDKCLHSSDAGESVSCGEYPDADEAGEGGEIQREARVRIVDPSATRGRY
jgi:integrase